MSRFTITTKEAGQSQVFNLKAVASAEDIIAVPAIQTGYYLIEDGEGNQLSQGLSLSRHNDALHIHVDESAVPSAIIPGYYNSPALLTIPASNNQLQALDMAQVQTEHAPVALSLLADAADAPYTPGAPGVIVPDGATDDSVDGSPKEIGNHEGTADLTPELHGTAVGAEEMILTIYANTQELGTVIVGEDGTWSFTPDEGVLSYDSNYIFQVVLQDSSSDLLYIAMPFTISESADGQAAADLPNTGDDGLVLIDHLVDANGIHQGDVTNNGVTDDLNPVIQGTLYGGEEMIVQIFANTQYIGTTIVNADGTWSFDLSGLENHAQYTIVAILQDSSSSEKFISLPFVFTTGFDEEVPVITSVHDDAGKITGDLTDGQPTDDTTPTINGTADPDAIVNIYDGSTLLGSAQADGKGNWTFTPETPLSGDGDHYISATATDGTDESANSTSFDVNLDTVCEKPVITDIEDDVGKEQGNVLTNGNITDDGNVVISGTSEPGSSLTLYFAGDDNVIQSLELTPNADGTWSIPSDYMAQNGDGSYSYWLTAVDAAGNQATSDIVHVTYKTSPPDASTNEQLTDDVEPKTGPILNGDTTDDSTPTYHGDAEPKDVVIISDNGKVIGSAVVDDKGHWSFTPDKPLDDGEHSFSTVVVDGNGNQSDSSAPIGFTVDTSIPDPIDINAPDNLEVYDDVEPITGDIPQHGVTNDTMPTFSGTTPGMAKGDIVTIYSDGELLGSAVVGDGGAWSFTPSSPMAEGPHEIELTVTNAAGAESDKSAPFDFTIDTIAPGAPVITEVVDDAGTQVVDVAQNGFTSDSTPEIKGTGELAGDIITVYNNGTAIGSAVVGADGTWSFTPDALADGKYDITVTETDKAGNVSDPSNAYDFTIDTVAPDAPVITDVVDDSAAQPVDVAPNGFTSDSTPVIQGTGNIAGDIITVYNNGTAIGSTTVNTDGSWSFTPDALADGTYDITVTETDKAGNVSDPSAAYDFTIDTVAPGAPVITEVVDDSAAQPVDVAQNGSTSDTTPVIKGTGDADGDIITVYNNGTAIGSAVVGADGTWSFTPDALADGTYDITVTETDKAGNVSDPSNAYDFTIDTVAPGAPAITDVVDDSGEQPVDVAQNGSTNDTTPEIQGTGELAGDIITVYNNGTAIGSTTVNTDGSWSFTPDALADGTYDITVTETDKAGNVSDPSNAYDFTINTMAPDAPVITDVVDDSAAQPVDVAQNGFTSDTTPVIKGTGDADGDIITVYNNGTAIGSAVVGADGTWSFTPDALADGTYDITVTETDKAGNVSDPSNAYDFTIDTVAPGAPVITEVVDDSAAQPVDVAQNGSTSDTTPVIKGTGDADGDIITVYNNGTAIGSAVVGADGTWSFTPDALADGTYDITVTETDKAGNVSDPSNAYDFTIDTVAPGAPAITDVVDDSGEQPVDVAQNGSTNDTTPEIQGTGELAGDIITVYNNGTAIGSTTVNTDGSWSFTPDALADGTYDITVTETDKAGNVSDPSNAYDFTINTMAPDAPVITDVVDDSAAQPVDVAQNGFTSDTTPVIKGTGDADGDIITVYNNGTAIGSAVVGADGTWSFTPDALADGKYDITVTETDKAGNVSDPSNAYDFTIDTVAPGAPVITEVVDDSAAQPVDVAQNGSTSDTTPVIKGTGDADGDIITVYNNGAAIGSAVVGADGTWSFTPDALADGTYDITVTETDKAGNVSDPSNAYDFTIDTVAPGAPAITDVVDDSGEQPVDVAQNGSTNDTTPEIQGTGELAGDIITVYNNGTAIGSTTVNTDGSWSFTPDALADGTYDITVTETDKAGNVSDPSNAYDFTINTMAPDAPVITDVVDDSAAQPVDVAQNGFTSDTTPVIKGTGDADGDIITVYNNGTAIGSAVVGADGTWSFTPDALADGKYDITVTETDKAGNVSDPSNAYDFTIDTVAPGAPVITEVVDDSAAQPVDVAQNGFTTDTTPVIKGTGDADGDIITVYNNGTAIGSAVVGADGTWSFTPDALADGKYDITVTETDKAGNVSDPSNAYDFTIDTVAPVAPVITEVVDDAGAQAVDVDPNGFTNDNTPTIKGTGENDGDIITVYNNGTAIGSAVVGADGTWSFTPAVALADGKYDITVTEADAAGNVSDPSNAFDFTIDTIAPGAPTLTEVHDYVGPQQGPIAENGTTDDSAPVFKGTGENDGDIITIYNDGAAIGSAVVTGGQWTFTPAEALDDGQYDITVTETDKAGNESAPTAPFDFTIATNVPDAATDIDIRDDSGDEQGVVIPGGATDDTTPVIEGNATAGDVVIISDNGVVIGSTTVDPDGAWSFTPDAPLDTGSHSIDTVVVDPATGAKSDPSEPVDFSVIASGSADFENVTGLINLLSDTPFTNHVLDENGNYKDLDGLSVTLLKPGYEAAGKQSEIGSKGVALFAPKSYGKVDMELSGNSQVRLDFGGQTNVVSFDVAAVTAPGTVVHYFDVNGNELGHVDVETTDPKNTRDIEHISWEAPAGSLISYVEIDVGPETSSGTIRMDNISWGETQYEPAVAAAPQAEALHSDVALMSLATQDHSAQHAATNATASTHDAPQSHLTLSLDDVLSQGADNAFIADGKAQFAVTGETGEHLDLTGVSDSSLAHTGSVTSGGVAYDVYSVVGSDTELLVQHGLELHTMA